MNFFKLALKLTPSMSINKYKGRTICLLRGVTGVLKISPLNNFFAHYPTGKISFLNFCIYVQIYEQVIFPPPPPTEKSNGSPL